MVEKRQFDPRVALQRIEQAIKPFPKAMLFDLAESGFNSPFEQLLACMVSIRTRDEVSLTVARELFERARTPEDLLRLTTSEIDDVIRRSSFHEAKAMQMRAIAQEALDRFDGQIPCDQAALMSFKGIGLKCANLVLGIACGEPRVAVDVHVHRVTNRWGFVSAKTPEASSAVLEERLPRDYWIDLNRLLVPFGKHICTGRLPRCSTCPVLDMCEQIGVGKHR